MDLISARAYARVDIPGHLADGKITQAISVALIAGRVAAMEAWESAADIGQRERLRVSLLALSAEARRLAEELG